MRSTKTPSKTAIPTWSSTTMEKFLDDDFEEDEEDNKIEDDSLLDDDDELDDGAPGRWLPVR